jgi:23S rRNA (adenine2503-C2)-methyltransferase
VADWLRKHSVTDFKRMTNLPPALRADLEGRFDFPSARLSDKQVSRDGTIKCAYTVDQDKVVEGVLIPTRTRMTACISSQAGCSLSCKFCATGRLKMMRNLSPGEIYDQVINLQGLAVEHYNLSLTNIVLMGMGGQ